jgi:hypothetical protein
MIEGNLAAGANERKRKPRGGRSSHRTPILFRTPNSGLRTPHFSMFDLFRPSRSAKAE